MYVERKRDFIVSISKTKVFIPAAKCMLEREGEGGRERERDTPMYQYLRLKFSYQQLSVC